VGVCGFLELFVEDEREIAALKPRFHTLDRDGALHNQSHQIGRVVSVEVLPQGLYDTILAQRIVVADGESAHGVLLVAEECEQVEEFPSVFRNVDLILAVNCVDFLVHGFVAEQRIYEEVCEDLVASINIQYTSSVSRKPA
jgi:hypothetical protein